MRILVVSQYFWPENFRINDLVTEMAGRGHEIVVLTGQPNYPAGEVFPEYLANPAQYDQYGQVSLVRVPMFPRRRGALHLILNYLSFALSACVVGTWQLRGKPFDLVFVCQLSPVLVGLPGALLSHLKRAPMVMWVLDLWPDTLKAIGVIKSDYLLRLVGRVVSFIYNRCEIILAQSQSFIPQMRLYCDNKKRIEYFPSWSDTDSDLKTVDFASEVPLAADQFTIVFAGNIGEAQDFPAILDAVESLKEEAVRWLIVGDGRAAAWVNHEIDRRGLERNIQLLGRFPLERMPSFYKHADALLVSLKDQPIFSMTIPGKLQSYLSSGIPVLAMLNGEGAEIIQRTNSGLSCPAGNGLALAEAVRHMMNLDKKELQAMGENGLLTSKREFDRPTLISQLIGWFEDLLPASNKNTGGSRC